MNLKCIILAAAIGLQLATGAAAQTVWSLPFVASKTVSVKQYGAEGDGVTDDTAAINAAIAAARDKFGPFAHGTLIGDATAYGSSVYFPPGTYKVTGTLNYPGGMTFYGDSRGSSIISFEPTTTDDLFAGDATHPSRNGDWWQVTWANLAIKGDFVDSGSSRYARRGIDISGAHQFKIIDCNIEGFASGVWGDEDQAYYGEIRGCIFVDNQQHIFQGAATGAGGIQPLRCESCTFRITTTMTNAGSANYPAEAIESERPLYLTDATIEGGGYFAGGDVTAYAGIRTSSGVSVNGLFSELQGAVVECDWTANLRHIDLRGHAAHIGDTTLFRITNYGGTDSAPSGNSAIRASIKTEFSDCTYVPLITNPFLVHGDSGYDTLTGCTYQTSVRPVGLAGAYLYTSTVTTALQTRCNFDIPTSLLNAYRGKRLYFAGLIDRNGKFPTTREGGGDQRFQVNDATATPYNVCDEPTIVYSDINGRTWEMWVIDFEVPDDAADFETIKVRWRLTAETIGDACYLGGFACWSDGFDMFPSRGVYRYLQRQADPSFEETLTASGAANTRGASELDSSGGALAITLADGDYIGQRKIFVMTDATASSTVSVTNHVTSDPEVFTFDAVDEYLVLMWSGTEWVTVSGDATTWIEPAGLLPPSLDAETRYALAA